LNNIARPSRAAIFRALPNFQTDLCLNLPHTANSSPTCLRSLKGNSKGHLENPEPSSPHKGGAISAVVILFEASQKASCLARKTHCLES
jgi:hypothetical protein